VQHSKVSGTTEHPNKVSKTPIFRTKNTSVSHQHGMNIGNSALKNPFTMYRTLMLRTEFTSELKILKRNYESSSLQRNHTTCYICTCRQPL